jgi:hypothetical protein
LSNVSLHRFFNRVDDFYIATPEKAVLDTLHLRKSLPAEDELEPDSIDIETMRDMAKKFPPSVNRWLDPLRSRLGWP